MFPQCYEAKLKINKVILEGILEQIYISLSFITKVLMYVFGITEARLCLSVIFKIYISKTLTGLFYCYLPYSPFKEKLITCLSVRYIYLLFYDLWLLYSKMQIQNIEHLMFTWSNGIIISPQLLKVTWINLVGISTE